MTITPYLYFPEGHEWYFAHALEKGPGKQAPRSKSPRSPKKSAPLKGRRR